MSVVKSLIATSLAFGLVLLVGCSSDEIDSTPPVVSGISHTDNQKITGSRTITVSADASDEVAVSSVVITHNGVNQTVTNNSGNYSASITLEDRSNNVIIITASDFRNSTSQTITLNYPFLAFTNGQAASVVIGQADFESFDANRGAMTPAINTLNRPYDVKVINGRLYIVDRDNHRILGFNSVPTTNDVNADFVIGQDSFTTNAPGLANNQLSSPWSIDASDTQLFVGHNSAGRINVWPTVPTSNSNASHVLGQSGFVTGSSFACNQDTFGFSVTTVSYVNGKIIAPDFINNRVFIWNTVPTISGVAPDLVLGQQSFNVCAANDTNDDGASNAAPTESTLSSPKSVWSDGARLVVTDKENHRVLIWNSFPTTNFQAADVVLGQADFITGDIGSATNATEFTQVGSVYSNGNQLFINDLGRIMIWDTWPTNNEQAADRVIGVADLNDSGGNSGNSSLSSPKGFSIEGDKLFIADTDNHRVMIFEAP